MSLEALARPRARARPRRSRKAFSFGQIIPVAVVALLASLPIVYVVLRGSEVGWQESLRLIFRPRVYELFRNTVQLSAAVTGAACLIGLGAAWFVERTRLPGKKLWNIVVALPLAVPAFVSSYTWVSISPNLQHFGGAVLIMTLSTYPLVYLPTAAALRGMDPALEETARSLGLSDRDVFFRVTLPHLRPALLGGALLVGLHMLAEYGGLAFLQYETFTTAIFGQYQVSFNGAAAAMLSSVLLLLSLAVLSLERLVRGRFRYARIGSGVARRRREIPLGRSAPFVVGAFALLALLAVGVPLGRLAFWIMSGSSAAFPLKDVANALLTTLGLGFGGALLTSLLAIPLVVLAVRSRGVLPTLAERLPYTVHAMPGVVIGLALVFFGVRYAAPLYQTVAMLLIAYAMLFLPLAQSSQRAALQQAPERLEEVARSLGTLPLGAFLRVTVPVILPGLGAGAALVFVQVMRELTATLILRPTAVRTLAFEVWRAAMNMEYAAAAPYAAVLILASGLPVYLLTTRSFANGVRGEA